MVAQRSMEADQIERDHCSRLNARFALLAPNVSGTRCMAGISIKRQKEKFWLGLVLLPACFHFKLFFLLDATFRTITVNKQVMNRGAS